MLPTILCSGLVRRGEVRGLIIGIDAYQYYKPLKGAVADARDIESALRNGRHKGRRHADRCRGRPCGVIREMDRLVTRTQANDLVLLSIAGHGAQEPERVKGSEPDGMDNVFLLPGFEPTPTGSQQRVLGREFNHFIKQLEFKGARVVFVADTCHGGGMVREIDPRAEEMSFRQVPSYRLTADLLTPVTTSTDDAFDRARFRPHRFPGRRGSSDQGAGSQHTRRAGLAGCAQLFGRACHRRQRRR